MAFRVGPLGSGSFQVGNRPWRRRAGQVAQWSQPAPSNEVVYHPIRYSPPALKLWSTVLESFAATVTFWVCSPNFS